MTHRLITTQHGQREVHSHAFNRWLAVKITRGIGTMWAAYVFAALALVSLPAAILSGETLIIVAWIAQTFLQLVLLPIIMVGQNVSAATHDARAEADHDALMKLLIRSRRERMLTRLVRDFEESHATYQGLTINGFEHRERQAHGCDLCARTRALVGDA